MTVRGPSFTKVLFRCLFNLTFFVADCKPHSPAQEVVDMYRHLQKHVDSVHLLIPTRVSRKNDRLHLTFSPILFPDAPPSTPEAVAELVVDICDALASLHRCGYVHR